MSEQLSDLSPDQTFDPEKLRRLFGSPIHVPPEFRSWMVDQMALNIPLTPVGQVFRGRNLARVMAHSSSAVTAVTATSTSPTTVFSFTLPKGAMTKNGRLIIHQHLQVSCADVSNLGHMYLYANNVQIGEFQFDTAFLDGSVVNASLEWVVQNRNSYASQRVYGFYWLPVTGSYLGTGSGTLNTVIQTIDTTQPITFEGRGVWGSAGSQNFSHHFYTASVYNPTVLA